MARVWIIAPYDSAESELFETAWNFDLKNNTIAMGWHELGDISKLERSDLENAYKETYADEKTKALTTRGINALWAFYHEIKEGDIIVARKGRKKILSIGKVIGSAYHDEKKGKERIGNDQAYFYPNFIPVAWDGKEIEFDRQVFSFYTIYEIEEVKLDGLLNERIQKKGFAKDDIEDREINVVEKLFVMEKYLEDFIVTNFDSVFKNKYELYRDPDGYPAQQYPVISDEGKIFGRIDILAMEKNKKDFLIIELKKGKESDPVVGQILRYIGWVQKNLCDENQSAKGLIICSDIDDKMSYAIHPVKNLITVKKYKVDFHLSDVGIDRN